MADSGCAARRFINPWVLHLQKLGLELKCPLCLNLFDQPMLLPCDHIFCKSCLDLTLTKLECPVCNAICLNSAIRPSPHTENLVSVYKNMDTTLSSAQQHTNSGTELCSTSASMKHCTSIDMQERICGSSNNKKDTSYHDQCNNLNKSEVKCDEAVSFEKGSTTISVGDRNGEQQDLVTETNPVSQSAPDSPPSLGSPRGDDDSSDQGSEHCLKGCQTVDSIKEKSNSASVGKHRQSQESVSHSRDAKRKKTSLCDLPGTATKNINQEEVDTISTKSTGGLPFSVPKQSLPVNPSTESKTKCAFCQSSKVSQKTGPLLHYFADGAPVKGDDVNLPNIIHVHEVCINWAPQVYYENDNVKSLKAELSRSAKLKCSKCGRKGAALGCYEKTCKKSFHVTCAMEISGCRWNLDNFLMLCPNHTSIKFPQEKSRNIKNTTVEDVIPSEKPKDSAKLWVTSESGGKEWLFCGSALTNDEKLLMMKLSTKHGIRVTKYWQPNVTHVIASTDEKGACCRTLKVLMGISHGIWIVKIDWIKACLEAQSPVDEEPYEVSIDNHGCVDGPKSGRLRALSNGIKIFAGLQFYLSGYFIPGFKRDLDNLLTAAGGTIINNAQELSAMAQEGHQAVIVYNLDTLNEGESSNPTLLVQQRREEAMNLARRVGDKVVAHTWLLESIAACKLLPWIM